MQNVLRKSLLKREKCYEDNICPRWLLNILPNRIKSIELIEENEDQSKVVVVDLFPFEMNNGIPQLTSKVTCENRNVHFEYPNEIANENQSFENSFQFLYSPSNQQLNFLFNKFKDNFQSNFDEIAQEINENKCSQTNCSIRRIPLTDFCEKHLIENDRKQILFSECRFCQQSHFEKDNKNLLHFCSYQI